MEAGFFGRQTIFMRTLVYATVSAKYTTTIIIRIQIIISMLKSSFRSKFRFILVPLALILLVHICTGRRFSFGDVFILIVVIVSFSHEHAFPCFDILFGC